MRPPRTWGLYAAGWNGRRAHGSAAAWSSAKVSFATAVRTFSMQCAPLGDQRICWLAPIRRCSSHCTVLSVVAVAFDTKLRRCSATIRTCSARQSGERALNVTALGVVRNRVTHEAGLALPGGVMARSGFHRWCEYGPRCCAAVRPLPESDRKDLAIQALAR